MTPHRGTHSWPRLSAMSRKPRLTMTSLKTRTRLHAQSRATLLGDHLPACLLPLSSPRLSLFFLWCSSLLWLTKAVVLRCGPPSSLAQCTRLLMHIASCSHTPLDGTTPPAQVPHTYIGTTRKPSHSVSSNLCICRAPSRACPVDVIVVWVGVSLLGAQADGRVLSSRRVTLALHAAEGFGVIMGHQHDTTHGWWGPISPHHSTFTIFMPLPLSKSFV